MRVLQLIDSLNAGGAERVAVTIANALTSHIEKSYLCTTRKEGALKSTLHPEVGYLFLERKKTLDVKAFTTLKKYVLTHKITTIHAHGTSYFLAAWLKLRIPSLTLVWHEHYGHRIYSGQKDFKMLYFCSYLFSTIITVTIELQEWCQKNLKAKQVVYVPNFIASESFTRDIPVKSNTIVCLANLRAPKNHLHLLKAFSELHKRYPTWKLQCIGADYNDAYSEKIKQFVAHHHLGHVVKLLGVRTDVPQLLANAKIGVLSSISEGLPMALLEYGAAQLAVVVTDVGYCKEVVSDFGKVVDVNEIASMVTVLEDYMSNAAALQRDAVSFQKHIKTTYSETAVLPQLVSNYI
ncbi:glycosyltransferase [Jejudonia soesokkakensis]|uniref:Glycosyltransferase n=1 Tax=Jejudonia soesokkakensis TaxID=1323432 RepID=A0ABW2MTN4_9FLAO